MPKQFLDSERYTVSMRWLVHSIIFVQKGTKILFLNNILIFMAHRNSLLIIIPLDLVFGYVIILLFYPGHSFHPLLFLVLLPLLCMFLLLTNLIQKILKRFAGTRALR